MRENEFEKLVNKDKYQVFIFTSLCAFPVTPARHSWFVVNKKGIISRWEILFNPNETQDSWGHLYKNYLAPTEGMWMYRARSAPHWRGKLLKIVEGDDDSRVKKMIDFIESSPTTYPNNYNYKLVSGPNSNAYASWVIGNFPEFKIRLPWNCFGKNYK